MSQEMNEQTSPQYLRTHKAICQALIVLLKDKPFERITVRDILDETPVSRTTFYKHFQDKYEVAEYLQQQFFQIQREMIHTMEQSKVSDYQKIIFEYAKKHQEMTNALYKISTETVNIRELMHLYHTSNFEKRTGLAKDSGAAAIYAGAMNCFGVYSVSKDLTKTDIRKEYNEAMIEAFLVLLSMEKDEKLRSYLYEQVEKDK